VSVERPALDYLLALEQFGIKFGLDNMHALVEALGYPDRSYRIAHIAGTNGKGSVTAMVDSALRAAGHRSARYTSPHLCDLVERFVVDGTPVTHEGLERSAARLQTTVQALMARGRLQSEPTFFEATTAIAFDLFRDARVDIAVCEVGLGGRLDATNVVSPTVTAITSIGHDHQQYLGPTLGEIAIEKAGIIKPGVPIVIGALPDEAMVPIARIAADRHAPLLTATDGVTIANEGTSARGGHRVGVRTARCDYGTIDLALAGRHQIGNAIVAIRVLEALDGAGIRVSAAAVRAGLATVRWPGRLERHTLPDGRRVLLDAAHNPEGAQALAAFLASEYEDAPTLVFTAMRDKDVRDMLRALAPHVHALVMTRATTPRCADPADLAATARAVGVTCPILVEPDLSRALETAWTLTPSIVVAGSIFLLGDAMKALGLS
jgi:dihydrofolate synthase/folylpolyglutamate synthase